MQPLNLDDILEKTSEITTKKVGFVAIVGRPNTGKSTFLNTLIGEKISIVSKVPQTTRKRVLGIFNNKESQVVFFDTPGIHKDKKAFNEAINQQAIWSLREADLILHFIDSSRPTGEEESYIEELLSFTHTPIIKIYTKTDLPPKIEIPENARKISNHSPDNFTDLMHEVATHLPEAPLLYPEDVYTSQDMRFRIAEIVREKVFFHTKEEIPHATFIEVEEIDDSNPDLLKIIAYIYTESDSQKYIIVGKNGSLITKIGKEAREELEDIFGKKVFIALRVKKIEKWRKDNKIIKKIFE